ncbi:MAG: FecR domain-containing protein [Pseudomonadota bacterium]
MNKLLLALSLFCCSFAGTASEILVQAVQAPAWVQRGTHNTPLSVGMVLNNHDLLTTGKNSRILLRAADGSLIKLGENASVTIDGLVSADKQTSLFTALLNVAKGAFRFTTSGLAKLRARDVTVKVAGATIGIRGTDVWGKDGKDDSGTEMGVVCLIEGKISVTGADQQAFVMDQPLTFYKMPKNSIPLPVTAVDPQQLKRWATETEIAQPAAQLGGKWKINLMTLGNEADALLLYDQWREAGYDVRLLPVESQGGWAYTLRLTQFASRDQAERLAAQLGGFLGAANPHVSR